MNRPKRCPYAGQLRCNARAKLSIVESHQKVVPPQCLDTRKALRVTSNWKDLLLSDVDAVGLESSRVLIWQMGDNLSCMADL